MRRSALILLLLVLPGTCVASPWGEYDLPIGDGYSIAVYEDTCLVKDGAVVLVPGDNQGTGSYIDQYATTKRHIFARTDAAFFILAKADDSVVGPLSASEFEQHPAVLASGPVKWKEPQDPHPNRLITLVLLGLLGRIVSSPWFYVPTILFVAMALLSAVGGLRRHLKDRVAV